MGVEDITFYLIPIFSLAGLMLLTLAPKPRYLTALDGLKFGGGKKNQSEQEIRFNRGHEESRKYKYEG
jgi:hypothetical protein